MAAWEGHRMLASPALRRTFGRPVDRRGVLRAIRTSVQACRASEVGRTHLVNESSSVASPLASSTPVSSVSSSLRCSVGTPTPSSLRIAALNWPWRRLVALSPRKAVSTFLGLFVGSGLPRTPRSLELRRGGSAVKGERSSLGRLDGDDVDWESSATRLPDLTTRGLRRTGAPLTRGRRRRPRRASRQWAVVCGWAREALAGRRTRAVPTS